LSVIFCFVVAFFFLLIKFVAVKSALTKTQADCTKFSKEIQGIYPNKDALIQALLGILPKARKVDVLDLRGFIFSQQDSPLFPIFSSSLSTDYRILLSDPDSANTAYRANCMQNKPIKAIKSEIQSSVSVITGLKKSNIKVRTYCSYSVLRLIFIDGELFVTPFRKGALLASAPTFKISANGALFKCYEALFSEIWDNQSENPSAQ